MRLATRMKLTYAIIFIASLLLIGIAFFGIGRVELETLKQEYDMEEIRVEMLYNPYEVLGKMSASVIDELKNVSETDPEKLLDKTYLGEIDDRLRENGSFIVIRKDNVIYYVGEHESESGVVHGIDGQYLSEAYISDQIPYHLRQLDFKLKDGSACEIQILTPVNQVLLHIKKIMIKSILAEMMVILFVGAMAFFWLYQSIVQPMAKLKKAAENIKNGNLDFNVATDTEDEIGEVCVAFEEMRKKLKEQIDVSMQYEKDNKELISNISHDLKTPITAIKGYVEGIRDGVADTPEKMDKYIRTIYNKATDMDKLIDELFLFSKLESNALTYSFVKMNLRDYFEDCADEISLELESKGINFEYKADVDPDVLIIADPEQLKRVINNIVGNSVKYMADRQGYIGLFIMEEPEFVQIEIRDNGKGISQKELPHIFERCYRTDASRNSSMGGSGLGLSIAKKIIEEHGGKIWATSVEGEGTKISFVLRKYKESVANE